jgi:hypothetical protein
MARGGPRNRSGPPADPNSGRSDDRGLALTALPSKGHRGRAPAFPLPDCEVTVDGGEASDFKVVDDERTARELVVWREVWKTPQAHAWALESWRWRTVALYVRYSVRMEAGDCPSSVASQVIRLADQIGLTPAGLRENGWTITSTSTAKPKTAAVFASVDDPRDRFEVLADGGG